MVTEANYISGGKYFGAVVLYGLKADSKPTDVANGSVFIELDTGKVFRFSAGDSKWYVITSAVDAKIAELENKVNAITYKFVSDLVTESPQKIGELGAGSWVCSVLYPLNLDVTVATNDNNDVYVTAVDYEGPVIALAFKV